MSEFDPESLTVLDSLVGLDPLSRQHRTRAHLYSAQASYTYCQWTVHRPVKMDEGKVWPDNQSIPSGQLEHGTPLSPESPHRLHIDLGISFSCFLILYQTDLPSFAFVF